MCWNRATPRAAAHDDPSARAVDAGAADAAVGRHRPAGLQPCGGHPVLGAQARGRAPGDHRSQRQARTHRPPDRHAEQRQRPARSGGHLRPDARGARPARHLDCRRAGQCRLRRNPARDAGVPGRPPGPAGNARWRPDARPARRHERSHPARRAADGGGQHPDQFAVSLRLRHGPRADLRAVGRRHGRPGGLGRAAQHGAGAPAVRTGRGHPARQPGAPPPAGRHRPRIA